MGRSAGCRGARGCGFGGSRSHKHTPLSPPSGQRCLSLHSFPALAGSQISLRGRGREGGRKNRTQSQPGKEESDQVMGGGRRKEGRRCGRGDIESQQDVISSASSQRGGMRPRVRPSRSDFRACPGLATWVSWPEPGA